MADGGNKHIFKVAASFEEEIDTERVNEETKNDDSELKTFVGPIALYKKNPELDFWQSEPLNDLFAGDRVFTKMENNSSNVQWSNGRYSMEQSSLSGGISMNEDAEEQKKS